jgi:sulfur transfer complex TusBCD TusB component (DsrH family)
MVLLAIYATIAMIPPTNKKIPAVVYAYADKYSCCCAESSVIMVADAVYPQYKENNIDKKINTNPITNFV